MSYRLSMEVLIFGSLAFCLAMLSIAWVFQQAERLVLRSRRRAELRARTSMTQTWTYEQNPHA